MRQPAIEIDYWQLRSAEASHTKYGEQFWIPSLEDRQNLKRGQAARLIFDIEADSDVGPEVSGERMWVIVSEKVGGTYIGILDNQPAYIDPDDDFYLQLELKYPSKLSTLLMWMPLRRTTQMRF